MPNTWIALGQKRIHTPKRVNFFAKFTDVKISIPLANGDLLESDVGQPPGYYVEPRQGLLAALFYSSLYV